MTALTARPCMLFSAVTILQHMHTIFPTHGEDTPLSSTPRGLQHLAPDRVRAAECANTLPPRRGSREGCLQRQWASASPPTSFSTSPFSFSSRQAPALQIGSGPPTTRTAVLYGDTREIFWRRLAPIAALRHLPHIAVSPRPRALHTSRVEECTYMNINMQTTPSPPLQISLCHTCRVLLSRDGRLSWVTPPIPFLPLPSGPPLLFSFLFLPLLPSNSHHRLGEA